jgi:hypothetical protein
MRLLCNSTKMSVVSFIMVHFVDNQIELENCILKKGIANRRLQRKAITA